MLNTTLTNIGLHLGAYRAIQKESPTLQSKKNYSLIKNAPYSKPVPIDPSVLEAAIFAKNTVKSNVAVIYSVALFALPLKTLLTQGPKKALQEYFFIELSVFLVKRLLAETNIEAELDKFVSDSANSVLSDAREIEFKETTSSGDWSSLFKGAGNNAANYFSDKMKIEYLLKPFCQIALFALATRISTRVLLRFSRL
jgi:hypothetical protein